MHLYLPLCTHKGIGWIPWGYQVEHFKGIVRVPLRVYQGGIACVLKGPLQRYWKVPHSSTMEPYIAYITIVRNEILKLGGHMQVTVNIQEK